MTKKKASDEVESMNKDEQELKEEKQEKQAETAENSGEHDHKKKEDHQKKEAEPETLSKEEEELNVRYLRLAADFQNYKKRVEKEKNDIYAYANEKIVVELLDVIDNFERALDHSDDNNEGFAEGMSMIFKQFKGVLERSGVEEMKAVGEQFDPNFHHAVMTENSVEYESGNVTQVLQKGYMLNKKVIRPAMVKVAE
jgi:Molecular chaperone GrpE (heat shock protein)